MSKAAASNFKCWKEIGVFGNGSCEKLVEFTHCKNCPVYTQSARNFFNRELPQAFSDEWTKSYATAKVTEEAGNVSLAVFRIRTEILAVYTNLYDETLELKPVHSVPFRSNRFFRGLVNISGELQLCFDLESVLELTASKEDNSHTLSGYKRLIVLKLQGEKFVFQADEVLGIFHVKSSNIKKPPSTISKSPGSVSEGIVASGDLKITILSEEKLRELFNTLLKR